MNSPKQTTQEQFPSFKKGITLEDYMKQSKQMNQNEQEHYSSDQDDLYQDIMQKQENKCQKMITFAIKEIQEEDYRQESSQLGADSQQIPVQPKKQQVKQHREDKVINRLLENFKDQNSTSSRSIDSKISKNKPSEPKGFRIKNQSNSPKKMPPSPKVQMFRSLYGNSFGGGNSGRPSEPSILSSTIHNKFFKAAGSKESNKKQAEFRQKNKKTYNDVLKFQNVVRNKYYSKFDILNIRIDGVKDRLCERKPFQKV